MENIIKELLNKKSFKQILEEYELERYELLNIISSAIFSYYSTLDDDSKKRLKDIYRKEAVMFHLTNEKIMFISDTHMESSAERLNWLKEVFQFCKDNGIHHIIHGGDIADGTYMINGQKKNIDFEGAPSKEAKAQVERILEKYPHDADIKQYILAGNHDVRYEKEIDILKALAQDKNIYPLGYYQAFFDIHNETISLEHESRRIYPIDEIPKLIEHTIKIRGHFHQGQFQREEGKDVIYLPMLGETGYSDIIRLPGFMTLETKEEGEDIKFQFKRFFYIQDRIYEPQAPFILKRKK